MEQGYAVARRVSRRALLATPLSFAPWVAKSASSLRASAFRCDVTPDHGEPLIWVTPAAEVLDRLWAKGVVVEDRGTRFVLCAVDWCGIGGSTHRLFRETIANAAGTRPEHVLVQTVHQHTAPYIDGDAYAVLRRQPDPPLCMSDAFLDRLMVRLGRAVAGAAKGLRAFDSVGVGEARVERVASARRLTGTDGKLVTRFSTGGSNPALAGLPEGEIDPVLRTVTLAAGTTPVVRLHYYTTHPQTFCCDGRVSADIVGSAREAVERDEKVPQIYFTGCAGDVTVGKYNDGRGESRTELARRLEQGMRGAMAGQRFGPADRVEWLTEEMRLTGRARAAQSNDDAERYRAAIAEAFARRKRPLEATLVGIGNARILHLPGEPMLEFQKHARGLSGDRFLAVAGYGDISPGYLCTDRAVAEGGYEPGASNAGPGTEAAVKQAIRNLFEARRRRG